MSPQGRLTLQPGKPVMDADVVSTLIYYTPYVGATIPVWNGSAFVDTPFSEMSLSLSGALIGNLYDVFASPALALGTAWAGNVRTSPISLVNGVWCDATHRVYLGTIYASGNGETRVELKPAPIPYGTNNIVGVWNAYNRVKVRTVCQDLTEAWAYASAGPRFANNSDRWRIRWVDGLAQSPTTASYTTTIAGQSGSPAAATVDAVLNATYPLHLSDQLEQAALNNTALGMALEGRADSYPKLGLNYYQAIEQTTAVSIMFYGNDFSAMTVELDA